MIILGINAYHGDAAAAIIKDGVLLAAIEEERFNRVKHCAGFPSASVRYCLETPGIGIEDVEHIGISRDPAEHLHKKVMFAATRAAKQAAGARRQTAGRETQNAVSVAAMDFDSDSKSGNGGNGNKGIFGQIKDRLNNAAKVRDLKDDLAAALGVSKAQGPTKWLAQKWWAIAVRPFQIRMIRKQTTRVRSTQYSPVCGLMD